MIDTASVNHKFGSADRLEGGLTDFIQDIGIPPRPAILQKLALEMHAPEPDFNKMTQLISRDVSLAAGLIKTANAPYFGLRQKVGTIREAFLVLGLASAARTVAGLLLRQTFPASPDLERFWDASDRTAQLSAWLVGEFGVKYGIRNEDAYTYALFRDCGIPILIRRFKNYKATLAKANSEPVDNFTETEETVFPTNHAIVGSLLAQSWWLPEGISSAIRYHHDQSNLKDAMPPLSKASRHLIALAQLGELLLQQASGQNKTCEWTKLGPICLEILDLQNVNLAPLELRAAAFLDSVEAI